MDSADEEPQLPSAIQDLIWRLEGKGEPITRLPDFGRQGSLSTDTWWRSHVRHAVLKAIGNCNTLEYLEIHYLCGGHISRLTDSEWDEVLSGFRSSTVLRVLSLVDLTWNSVEEVESLCLKLGTILNTSSVANLAIISCKLSAICYLNLASGMRGKSECKLKSLDLHNAAWEDSSALEHVTDMINSATRLEMLSLGGTNGHMCDMDEEVVRTLSQAINLSSSIKTLKLVCANSGASDLLREVFASDDGNRSIEHLQMMHMPVRGHSLRDLLIYKEVKLKEVKLYNIDMFPEEWRAVGQAIRVNTTVKTVEVSNMLYVVSGPGGPLEGLEEIARAASSHDKDPIMEVTLNGKFENLSELNILGKVLRGEIKSVKSFRLSWGKFSISGTDNFQERLESIFPINRKSGDASVLESLELYPRENTLNGIWWKHLFLFLRGNTSLTHLTLGAHVDKLALNEEAFRELMGLLQVNLSLREIDVRETSWAMDGKAAQIVEALKQNERRAVYMSVFRETKLAFGDARAGRLFLCGSPGAGKTQLRQTLMKIGKSRLRNKWEALKLRTKGIEVELLQNNDQLQISIWDLAGQGIFRTLQSVLFPQTSNFCVFIFVYSPFCDKKSLEKPDSCLHSELREWLSFISSSTRVTGHNRPQVLVVISHKDKLKSTSLTWAHPTVKELADRFSKFVDLQPILECFHVDARKVKQVFPLKNHILETFKKLLSEKSPQIPLLCSHLSSLLVTNTKENRSCPVWPSQTFDDFCLKQLSSFSSTLALDHSRIMKSIISCLNDIGAIVSIPNVHYIIVDPNWLTNTLLGELVALGQDFQAKEYRTSRHDLHTSRDGFVSEKVFADLIQKFLGKQPRGEQVVNRELIEDILINLDLCFKLENTSKYFIPSFIPEHASLEEQKYQEGAHVELKAWETRVETSKFVGIRIQCQDERTMSLSAAFFPCFQMFMRRKLMSETMTCSRHYLRLFHDGHEIYVEQDKSHNFVDVLMLYSKHKSREGALKYAMKHIVQELISFCASPKGCPGVALVLGVIQTICVKMLIPSQLRGAILIEDLKSKFIRNINDKLEDIPLEKSLLEKEDELFNYEHSWPLIRDHTTQVIFERARELLWDSDVEAVVNETRQKRMQQLESLQQGLIQQVESLQRTMNNDLVQTQPSNRPSSRLLSRASTSVGNRSTRLVLSTIHQLREDLVQRFDGVDEGLKSVVSIVERLEKKVGQIISLQQELQSTLSAFMSKVDTIIQYSSSLQQPRAPKRPYVTDDVGIFCRVSAFLHVGTIVRLHLMCESVTGYHTVKDQEGLMLQLNQENRRWIRNTIEISYKVLYYAVKAGLEKTVGLGQAIPDWADLKSDIVQLDVSDRDRVAVVKVGESKELKEAWLRIQQTLEHVNYSAKFKLYQVNYVRPELGGHAWVCEECMNKGRASGILTD
ncbi:hypothetical protein MPTK1_8g11970 [Marchantia polymorpha subsp. ruderalis]|nr:hypothetical protein Mp_8g11970 [Marchantia polymorpha subsp. ruderalis]